MWDVPAGLEAAEYIIKKLDMPKKKWTRGELREGRKVQEEFFIGKVLQAGKESLTIKTRDGKKAVTLYVPLRKKEDGTRVLMKEFSVSVARQQVGSIIKVYWRQGEEGRWIEKIEKVDE